MKVVALREEKVERGGRSGEEAEWPLVPLSEVCDPTPGTRAPSEHPDAAFRYVDITGVDNKQKRILEARSVLGKDAPSRARKVIRNGDVIVATTRPNLNAVAVVPDDLDNEICSTGFCVLRPTPRVRGDYLFMFVRSAAFVDPLSDLVKGALYPAVSDKQVLAQRMLLPPLPEQERIAARLAGQLAEIERARAASLARVAAAESLPAAYLRDVFDGPEAQEWESKAIGDFAKTCSGATPSRSDKAYFGGGIPWVKTGELRDGFVGDDGSTEESVTEAALRDCSLPLLPAGTLLIAMYGQGKTRGRTGLLTREATTNQACFAILPRPDVFDTGFVQLWFRANYDRLRALTENRGGNQPNLNGVLLRDVEVPLPLPADQCRIAADLSCRLAEAERLRVTARAELAAIEALPAALLRAAFQGNN